MLDIRTLEPPIAVKNKAIRDRVASSEHRSTVEEAAAVLGRRRELAATCLERSGHVEAAIRIRSAANAEKAKSQAIEVLASPDPMAVLQSIENELTTHATGIGAAPGRPGDYLEKLQALRDKLREDGLLVRLRSERCILAGRRERELRIAEETIKKGFSLSHWKMKD